MIVSYATIISFSRRIQKGTFEEGTIRLRFCSLKRMTSCLQSKRLMLATSTCIFVVILLVDWLRCYFVSWRNGFEREWTGVRRPCKIWQSGESCEKVCKGDRSTSSEARRSYWRRQVKLNVNPNRVKWERVPGIIVFLLLESSWPDVPVEYFLR